MNNAIQHSERPLRNIVWQTPTLAAPWARQDDAMAHGLWVARSSGAPLGELWRPGER